MNFFYFSSLSMDIPTLFPFFLLCFSLILHFRKTLSLYTSKPVTTLKACTPSPFTQPPQGPVNIGKKSHLYTLHHLFYLLCLIPHSPSPKLFTASTATDVYALGGIPPMLSKMSNISIPPMSGPMAVWLISAPHWSSSGSRGKASQS